MASQADKKTKYRLASVTDLTALKVDDYFYELRKTSPLDLLHIKFHEPRKYRYRGYEKDDLKNKWDIMIVETSLNLVFLGTERKLNTFKSRCIVKKNKLPYNLFSWSVQDVINRLQLTDALYLDLIAANFSVAVLDSIKLQIDLTQVLEIFNIIATEFMNNTNLQAEIIPTLREYEGRDRCVQDLNIQFEKNKKLYRIIVDTINKHSSSNLKTAMKPRYKKLNWLNQLSDAIIPIQDRYKVNWYRTNTFFRKLKNSKFLHMTIDQIDGLNNLIDGEEEALTYKLTMYNVQRTNFMDRFDALTEKYELDFEDADNTNGVLRVKLNKAIEDLKLFKEQVVYFKRAVIETKEIIRLEELAREELERKSEPPPPVKKPKKDKKAKK